MKPFRIAVFASGSGSNFQAIVDAVRERKLEAEISLLVCDKPKAYVVERAASAGVETFAFRPKDYESKQAYESEIVARLRDQQIDLVVLAGYMRIVSETLLAPYEGRIVNIHPSLLPAFPGLNAIGQALAHGVKVTGVTVHFVDGGMDTGPIIAQRAVEVADDDTEETLAAKIHPVEHELYPAVIRAIGEGRIRLAPDGRRVLWS
jgi:phosphoribosylglycinamide formyltransferase-1